MPLDPAGLRIVSYPAAVLRTRCEPVEEIDETVRAVVARMIELMHEANGAGLSAPQVGLSWSMFVTRGDDEGAPDAVFINPKIKVEDDTQAVAEEGCLSLPGLYVNIRRPVAVSITALDLDGTERTLSSADFPARVWQHEFDHLEGVLIIDRMSPMDRIASRKTLKELRAAAEGK